MKPLEKATNQAQIEHCASLVMEIVPTIMRTLRTEMRSHRSPDLSVPQFRALNYVSRNAGASLSDVAEHVGLTLPSMSKLIDTLVGRRLLTREVASDDRRRLTLALTASGHDTLHNTRQATLARLAQDLAILSPEECAAVSDAMHILSRAFTPDSPESSQRP